MIFNSHKKEGFTLVETLVAISILLFALAGPLTIAARTSQSTSFSNQQVIAFFLAQEGAEIAQKIRDDEALLYLEEFNALGATAIDPWEEFMNRSVGDPYERCFDHIGNSTDNSFFCYLELFNPGGGAQPDIQSGDCRNNAITNCQIYLRNGPGNNRAMYTHNSGGGAVLTAFTRTIQIREVVAGQEAEIISRVTWRSGALFQGQEVEIRTSVFNIYEQS